MPFALIPFLLLIIPIAEISGFIVIGDLIGLWPTLGMILVTAIGGSILLRVQGFGILSRIQNEIRDNKVPARDLVHGVMIMIAGVLLLTPGFITDTLGFLLFVPALRDGAWRLIKSRISVTTMGAGAGGFSRGGRPGTHDDGTIDLDEDDYAREPDPDSPWADDKKREIDSR